MPVAQRRNDAMQQLNSVDQASIKDRNFAGEWYDNSGGVAFDSAIVLNLDTERINTAPTVFVMAADILTITEAGVYKFEYKVTASHSSGSSAAVLAIYLEEDPATGSFAIVPASIHYATQHTVGFNSAQSNVILRVGINYRYRVRVARSSGSDQLLTTNSASKLSVVRMWKNG